MACGNFWMTLPLFESHIQCVKAFSPRGILAYSHPLNTQHARESVYVNSAPSSVATLHT